MRQTTCLIFGLLTATATSGADGTGSDEARAMLKKAAEALKKVQLVQYDFDFKGTGGMSMRGGSAKGTMLLGLPSKWALNRFRCDVELEDPSSAKPRKVTVASDGNGFFFIDYKRKRFHEDMDPSVLGNSAAKLQPFLLAQFIADEPLKAELEAEKIELGEPATIGGEKCFQVVIQGKREGRRTPDQVWFFAEKDYLPRRFSLVYTLEGQTSAYGSWEMTLTNIVIDPKTDDDPFKLEAPEGFTTTDEAAR